MKRALPIACLLLAASAWLPLAGCGGEGTPEGTPEGAEAASTAHVQPPLEGVGDPYVFARRVEIGKLAIENHPTLHNVARLSDNIVTGGEPLDETALELLAQKGIKTILSVDGKVPDAATAKQLGMRYVHVPIRYGGILPGEMAKIAKTFRELPGPFFVHCFHGKHRGPAAAAVGRVVLDHADRKVAMAEMVQCGTAAKYAGLYRSIAEGAIPDAQATRRLAFAFDEAHPFQGVRAGMVRMTRSWDELKLLQKRRWETNPDHPDIDAFNEAEKVEQLIAQMAKLDDTAKRPEDYRAWMDASVEAGRALRAALARVKAGDDKARDEADEHFGTFAKLCSSCHTPYRNRHRP